MSFTIATAPRNAIDVELNIPLAAADPIQDRDGRTFYPNRVDVHWYWQRTTGWVLDGFMVYGLDGTQQLSRWQGNDADSTRWADAAYWKLAEATRPAWNPAPAQQPA